MAKRTLIDDYHIEITSTEQLSRDEVMELHMVMYSCQLDIINLIKDNMRESTAGKLQFTIAQ